MLFSMRSLLEVAEVQLEMGMNDAAGEHLRCAYTALSSPALPVSLEGLRAQQ